MGRNLIVHSDQRVLQGFQNALKANTLVQALKYVASATTPIRAIYIDSEDVSFSPLKFVEACLLQRPATPIYVFNSKIGEKTEDAKLLEKTLVRGWANPSPKKAESYMKSGKLAHELLDDEQRKIAQNVKKHPGFFPVPISDFHLNLIYPFDIFIEADDGMLRLFALANTEIDVPYFTQAAEQTDWAYIQTDQLQTMRARLKDTQKNVIKMDFIPTGWKSSEIFSRTQTILNEARSGGLQENLLEQTTEMLATLFSMIQEIQNQDENALARLIDRAKRSDRTMACATISFLVCRAMRFEKSSTVEILGVASILQDVSLFETPFGDLTKKRMSELSPNEMAHYQMHPMHSADLIEQSVSLPHVTLQVIRQSHERRDKSGYPNRIGGIQLHPMAEILSLINSYLDLEITNESSTETLRAHVFPHYSEKIVNAFETVLKFMTSKTS